MSHTWRSHSTLRGLMTFLPSAILSILSPFATLFSRPVWNNALILLLGAILCRGKRTVCAILRIMGLSQERGFAKHHHVLNRVEWSPLKATKILLHMYEKNDATFSDLLIAVRKVLWKDNLIFRKHIFEPFRENNKPPGAPGNANDGTMCSKALWQELLIEYLAAV